jgi:hypothetical protein
MSTGTKKKAQPCTRSFQTLLVTAAQAPSRDRDRNGEDGGMSTGYLKEFT